MIDRNVRTRIGVKLRSDSKLTFATRTVGNAALFGCMDAKTGRCQASRARLAHEAACSKRTVTRATNSLQANGYIKVAPTYGPRMRAEDGRWFRPRGPNVLEWVIPEGFFLSAKLAADPSLLTKTLDLSKIDPELQATLARFGSALLDRCGLPPT